MCQSSSPTTCSVVSPTPDIACPPAISAVSFKVAPRRALQVQSGYSASTWPVPIDGCRPNLKNTCSYTPSALSYFHNYTRPRNILRVLPLGRTHRPPFLLEERLEVNLDIGHVFASAPCRNPLFKQFVHLGDGSSTDRVSEDGA